MRERGKDMKLIVMFEDISGGKHDTAKEAARADRIYKMRQLSNGLIAQWQQQEPDSWTPGADVLSVILQRLGMSKGFAILRKV